MRLLITTDAVGGVWSWAIDLVSELTRMGVQTTLAVLGPSPTSSQLAAADAAPGLELVVTRLPLDWTAPDAAALDAAGEALAVLARQRDVAAVLLHSAALAARGRFDVPVAAVCHSCVGTWWAAVRGGPLPGDLAWRAELMGRGLRAVDALIAPSRAFARATAAFYGLRELPRVQHNGRYPPAEAPSRAPTAPPRYVLTAGRLWDPGKDTETLDVAAGLLTVPVVALGPLDGPDGARWSAQHLVTAGAVSADAVLAWMAHAQAFVSVARYEPFGLAVLEAAQAGLPLVLSDIPSFRELWDGAAEFVPMGDANAVADIIAALDTGSRRQALGAAAARRARRYTVAAMANGTLSVLRDMARSRAA